MCKAYALFLTMLALFFVCPASARVPSMSLEQAVAESDLVIVGQIAETKESANEGGTASRGTVIVKVETVLKGVPTLREVAIIYVPCVQAGSAHFHPCERCVFFLQKANNRLFSGVFFANQDDKYITTG